MIRTISRREAAVLDGKSYSIRHEDTALAKDAVLTISLLTPPSGLVDIYGEYNCIGGSVKVEFLQGSTISSGDAYTPVNQNDNSTRASGCTVKTGVTISADGTVKRSRTMFSAANVPSRSDSSIGDLIPRVLKPNTQYVLRLTALDGTTGVSAGLSITEQ